jgi:hypothetical protein
MALALAVKEVDASGISFGIAMARGYELVSYLGSLEPFVHAILWSCALAPVIIRLWHTQQAT